jgi:ubiquinone biosynthesis protein
MARGRKAARRKGSPAQETPATPAVPVEPAGASAPVDDPLAGFELLVETRPPGIVKRYFTTHRHFLGLLFGGARALARSWREDGRKGIRTWPIRFAAAFSKPWLDENLRDQSFPVQLRRRLEILGPTYIKLGQVLSLREDILPTAITDELKNLLDRLPVVPFSRYQELIADALDAPPSLYFAAIDPRPIGSASIAQTHRARTKDGDDVILKVVKPGIKELLTRDAFLLRLLGTMLEWIVPRVQPKRVLREFCDYTLREVDLRREADNAETFAANFKDLDGVRFPKIYRQMSGESILTMEFFNGAKPNSPAALALPQEDKDALVDAGAAAIIRMLFRDGFFHADLHPGNLMILDGPKVGFIDLGMVGRFDEQLRRTLMYYYYCLVTGDSENAARYLALVAQPGPGGDPQGFRRGVEEICRRWSRAASFRDFSLAQLILRSVALGVQYRMYFPVEMVLMVKALVTFEGVGQMMNPGFDVAEVSQKHVNALFLQQFNPLRLARDSMRGAPEVVDILLKAPFLVSEGFRFFEQATQRPRENPFAGLKTTLFAGFALIAGAILAAFGGPWPVWTILFLLAAVLALVRGR